MLEVASNRVELTKGPRLNKPCAQSHDRKNIEDFELKESKCARRHHGMTSLIDQALEFQAVFQS